MVHGRAARQSVSRLAAGLNEPRALHDANDLEEDTEQVRQSESWSHNSDGPLHFFVYCFYYSNRWLTPFGPSQTICSSRTNELLLRLHRQRPPSSVGSRSTPRTNGDEIITARPIDQHRQSTFTLEDERCTWTHQLQLSPKVANRVRMHKMRLKMG